MVLAITHLGRCRDVPRGMAPAHFLEGVVQVLGDLFVLVLDLIQHNDRLGEGVVVREVSG
ncbi:hypothetical protein D3C78_995450 [compost metagenome]